MQPFATLSIRLKFTTGEKLRALALEREVSVTKLVNKVLEQYIAANPVANNDEAR